MTKVYISKHSAVQRQLDAAIRWLFEGEDPLPIHTVVAAAYGLVKDLLKVVGVRCSGTPRETRSLPFGGYSVEYRQTPNIVPFFR